jgi:hypothetical protein
MLRSPLSRRRAALARWIVALALGAALPSSEAGASCPEPTATELEVVDRINAERADAGLAPVEFDARLHAAAVRHSEDMRDGCFLSHTGSDGSTRTTRMLDAGYPDPGREAAGAGQTSPRQIVSGWMASSTHRSILLDANARHVGVGEAQGPEPCQLQPFDSTIIPQWWTADFGRASGPAVSTEESCSGAPSECSDGLDNDGNGLADYPDDPLRCQSADDPVEAPGCSDGIDNDDDGLIDHGEDAECLRPDQISELDPRCGLGFELILLVPLLLGWRCRADRRAGGRGPGSRAAAG